MLPALLAALSNDGPAVFAGPPLADLPLVVPQRVAVVVQSSGSTARPKRVALSADALLASAAASASSLGGEGQWVLALPTTYIAGINVLVRSISAGTDAAQVEGHFSAAAFVSAAGQLDHPLRFTSLVPAQLATLLEDPAATAALQRFERVLLGGQASPPALLQLAADRGIRVTRTYGSSETSGGCVYDGVPIGTAQVRVADGQVELAGPMLAEGYLDEPTRTDASFYTDAGVRWYRTGDLGQVTNDVLTVTGRADDVIVSGGLKVPLGELEALLRRSTQLVDAVVLAADDERWGQVPVVVATRDMPLDELRALAVAELGVAAAPSRLVVVERIPLLASGKPDRVGLRREIAR